MRANTRKQDSIASFVCSTSEDEVFVGLVADGAGTATFGGEGASLVVRSLSRSLRAWFSKHVEIPTYEEFAYWLDQARDLLTIAAARRASDIKQFACTLVCVVSTGGRSVIAHVGDGCGTLKLADTGEWIAPSWPYHGEYASTTCFVSDQPEVRLVVSVVDKAVCGIVLFSDGIERLALDFRSNTPHQPFLERMLLSLSSTEGKGRSAKLSQALSAFLDSDVVCSRTDDDKSIVIAAR